MFKDELEYCFHEKMLMESVYPLKQVIDSLRGESITNEGSEVVKVISPLFANLDWIKILGRRWLRQIADGGVHMSPIPGAISDSGTDLIKGGIVFRNHKANISLQLFDSEMVNESRRRFGQSDTIELSGRISMIRVVGFGELSIDMIDHEELNANSDLDEPCIATASRSISITSDQPELVIDGKRTAFRITKAVGNPLVLIVTILTDQLPFRCSLERSTGRVVSIAANSEQDNLVRMLMTVSRELGDPDRGELLEQYLDHPTHFVRWHSIRELVSLRGFAAITETRRRLSREESPYVKRGLALIEAFLQKRSQSTTEIISYGD